MRRISEYLEYKIAGSFILSRIKHEYIVSYLIGGVANCYPSILHS